MGPVSFQKELCSFKDAMKMGMIVLADVVELKETKRINFFLLKTQIYSFNEVCSLQKV